MSAVGEFSIGRDGSDVVLILDGFGRVDLSEVTGFDAKPIYEDVTVKPNNKKPIRKSIPMGYEGNFEVSRANGNVERLQAFLDRSFWEGRGLPVGTMYQAIRNPDSTRTTLRWDGVALKVGNLGEWKSDAAVSQQVSFFASGMTQVEG